MTTMNTNHSVQQTLFAHLAVYVYKIHQDTSPGFIPHSKSLTKKQNKSHFMSSKQTQNWKTKQLCRYSYYSIHKLAGLNSESILKCKDSG